MHRPAVKPHGKLLALKNVSTLAKIMDYPQKNLSISMKFFVLFAIGLFTFALIKVTISTTAQSSQSKRQLDDRVPGHLPIKVKIKKEKEEGLQDLNNERWVRDFELEVKNTGNQPIYALSLLWMLEEVKMPDGNPYGSTFRYGRSEFITVPGEKPRPEDIPIKPGETYIFKLSNSSVEGWENWAKNNHLSQPKSIQIFFNFICFGDGTGWEGPKGERRNGFIALAEYDKPSNGGNKDGVVSSSDAIFSSLRLRQDANQNGISEASELKTLSDLGLMRIELNYKLSKKTDEHGNKFRYRAKVKDVQGNQAGRWAWDVLLIAQP